MKNYEAEGIFEETKNPGVMMVERTLRSGVLRKGIVLALDLEHYSFKQGSSSLIRATEKTIESRSPPRLKVRRDARFELPHIIVLIDDEEDSVISSISDYCDASNCAYETSLMEQSGFLKGYWIDNAEALERLSKAIRRIGDAKLFSEKYGPDQICLGRDSKLSRSNFDF